ncbi:DNA helicase II [Ventosimonas gracilis]|uniref:DNA 3'-5' helicase n=1 Tax=Ventosimonas gracilis TaxID=1680762 RepID=A0A139SJB4_9GAMM|nr:DNA helicase II [Ventosimonas gracilis]KXU34637.1 DNA helicase II [Ventosimonas gracilis]
MSISPDLLLASLNDAQRRAVAAPLGCQLVLAGAGSGKTRVLVQRIAFLIQCLEASRHSVLAVTFTNKAAGEMRQRLGELLGESPQGMWVGTFHGLAHRLLRAHWQEAKLEQNFQILDSEDQQRLIKRVIGELSLDEKQWPARQAQWFINQQKDEGRRSQHIQAAGDPFVATQCQIYQAYEAACTRAGVIDFAELLLRALDLWRDHPALLAQYQRRFQHILVDEFQDTNAVQYAWLRLLAAKAASLMVVGDDDQSIYGWRGAKIENIQQFSKDFAGAQIVRLEQNYRSSGTILKAANALIAHNQERLGKALWSDGGEGEPLLLYSALNEQDEARFVAGRIERAQQDGLVRREIAILYRSNAQSRALEEALLMAQIPYRIHGGLRFYDRAEIRNAIAWLRLLENRDNDAALERVINLPPRGIGERTVQILRDIAREQGLSMWTALQRALPAKAFPARAASALSAFIKLLDTLEEKNLGKSLAKMVQNAIEGSGLLNYHREEKGSKAQARVENLGELVGAARAFQEQFEKEEAQDDHLSLLQAFLAHASLEAGDTQGEADEDCVQLMTLHSAKGLEFPLVFLVGMEDGLFPHGLTLESAVGLEEERRLAYVGITRAMRQLVLTHAEQRWLNGSERSHPLSRFVREIPQGLIEEVRPFGALQTPAFNARAHTVQQAAQDSGFRLGQSVYHPLFGEGVIMDFEGSGKHTQVQVKFIDSDSKWLVLSHAKLQAI